jgi:MYXO-CTERM domain-containing protein
MQARFNKDNWTNFNEADDHSFDPTKTSFTDWNRVTAYQNGTLIWGVEPAGAAAASALARAGDGDRDGEHNADTGGCGVAGGRAGAPAFLLVLVGWILGHRRRIRVQA